MSEFPGGATCHCFLPPIYITHRLSSLRVGSVFSVKWKLLGRGSGLNVGRRRLEHYGRLGPAVGWFLRHLQQCGRIVFTGSAVAWNILLVRFLERNATVKENASDVMPSKSRGASWGAKHRSLISSQWDSNIILCRWEIRPISSADYVEKYGIW